MRAPAAAFLVLVGLTPTAAVADGGDGGVVPSSDRWEVSAPIFPKVLELYSHEGQSFPATLEGEQALADSASLNFEALLGECAASFPGIKLWVEGEPQLTRAELEANYDLVAQCAYERYTAKPYWIPQLVDDVDLCVRQLGADWRLITEADLSSLDEAAFTQFASSLASASSGSSGMGGFYFSLAVYLRGDDGTLKLGNLNPGVTERVTALPVTTDDEMRRHLEASPIGPVVVRCIRHSSADGD